MSNAILDFVSILHLGLPALSTPRGPKVTGEAKNGSSVTLDLKRDEFSASLDE